MEEYFKNCLTDSYSEFLHRMAVRKSICQVIKGLKNRPNRLRSRLKLRLRLKARLRLSAGTVECTTGERTKFVLLAESIWAESFGCRVHHEKVVRDTQGLVYYTKTVIATETDCVLGTSPKSEVVRFFALPSALLSVG